MDETYIRANGDWKYLYRAVDKAGKTADFLLPAKRDQVAAKCFLEKAMRNNDIPEKITIDQSGTARNILPSIELMHMIRKGHLMIADGSEISFAD